MARSLSKTPFLVKNKNGDVLDRRNYCGWKAPEYGDNYSDFRSDYDFSPENLAQQEALHQAMSESTPDHIKQAIAEREKREDNEQIYRRLEIFITY